MYIGVGVSVALVHWTSVHPTRKSVAGHRAAVGEVGNVREKLGTGDQGVEKAK